MHLRGLRVQAQGFLKFLDRCIELPFEEVCIAEVVMDPGNIRAELQ